MEFCKKCGKLLIKTEDGLKCQKCDDCFPIRQNLNKGWKNEIIPPTWEKFSGDKSFPFIPGQFYPKKEIWRTLGISSMGGIRYNTQKNFLVVFLDAHASYPKSTKSNNIYQDHFDPKTGLYHYTGAGQEGDQTLTGRNAQLANAKLNNTKIHFFRQERFEGKHQYIGEVEVVQTILDTQPDKYRKKRKVYVFWLRPIQNVI